MDSSKRLIVAGSAIVAFVAIAGIVVTSQSSSSATSPTRGPATNPLPPAKTVSLKESEEQKWKSRLTEEQYAVTREGRTERAFTGKYWNHKAKGIYKCVCCETSLFDSAAKFDSGTGWPSFWQPIEDQKISTEADFSAFTQRTEVRCAKCNAHLGHLFEDGPQPTGLRYCINSAALEFDGDAVKTANGF